MGNYDLLEDVIRIATNFGVVEERIQSDIKKYSDKVKI